MAPADSETKAAGDASAAPEIEALLDELLAVRARRRRVWRWLRLIGLAILVAYAVAIAAIGASFEPRELNRGFEFTADGLAGGLAEELPGDIADVAPVLIDAARKGVLQAWPKLLVKADKRFTKIEQRAERATGRRFTAASRQLLPRLEQDLDTRFPGLEERPAVRSGIAGALYKALTRDAAQRSRERLARGRETALRGFASLAEIAEAGVEPVGFRQRMISTLRYLAAGPDDPDAGPQADAAAVTGQGARR